MFVCDGNTPDILLLPRDRVYDLIAPRRGDGYMPELGISMYEAFVITLMYSIWWMTNKDMPERGRWMSSINERMKLMMPEILTLCLLDDNDDEKSDVYVYDDI